MSIEPTPESRIFEKTLTEELEYAAMNGSTNGYDVILNAHNAALVAARLDELREQANKTQPAHKFTTGETYAVIPAQRIVDRIAALTSKEVAE